MRKPFLLLLWSFILLSAAAALSEAAPGWLESGIFPETETPETEAEGPSWGSWFMPGDVWIREAVNPDSVSAGKFFMDVNGNWFDFDAVKGDIPVPGEPPEWYPWEDTPEKRGLAPKGNDENLVKDKNRSFSWGEWEDHFGLWFRRITPPGQPLVGATHLVDENGSCFILVVYPGATPRSAERFSWFPGFPPGWGIKPGTTILVNKGAE